MKKNQSSEWLVTMVITNRFGVVVTADNKQDAKDIALAGMYDYENGTSTIDTEIESVEPNE